jgi:hypothetical protein
MRLIIRKVHEKQSGGDYAEFEEMRASLVAFAEQPADREQRRVQAAVDRKDLIRMMAILAS